MMAFKVVWSEHERPCKYITDYTIANCELLRKCADARTSILFFPRDSFFRLTRRLLIADSGLRIAN